MRGTRRAARDNFSIRAERALAELRGLPLIAFRGVLDGTKKGELVVGVTVGTTVDGKDDGRKVGGNVEAMVGEIVGILDGISDGMKEGTLEGPSVGD